MANKTPQLTVKSVGAYSTKILNEEEGIVEAFVAGIGNKDSVGDIIQPGAFDKSLKTRRPKGIWSHDWNKPVSKTLEAYEVPAGDSRLPERMKTAGIGGLYVRTQFNLDTEDGRNAFSNVKFFGDESEWSIGYQVPPGGQEYDKDKKAMLLKQIELFEYSPVLFGANPLTATVSAKVHLSEEGTIVDVEVTGADDETAEKIKDAVNAAVNGEAEKDAEPVVEPEVAPEATVEDAADKGDAPEVPADKDGEGDDKDPAKGDPEGDQTKPEEEAGADDSKKVEGSAEEPAGDAAPAGEPAGSEVVEDAKASPTVDFVKGALAVTDLSRDETQSIVKFIESRCAEKAVPGSYESRMDAIRGLLREEFGGDRKWTWPVATFESTVVFVLEEWDGESYKTGYYEVSYTESDGDFSVTGEPVEVDLIEVIVAKHAIIDAAFKGFGSELKALLRPLVDVAEKTAEEDADVKTAVLAGLEAKAGRALSKANQDKLKGALEAIQDVLDSAAASDEEDTDEKSASDQEVLDNKDGEADEAKAADGGEEAPFVLDAELLAELESFKALAATPDSEAE